MGTETLLEGRVARATRQIIWNHLSLVHLPLENLLSVLLIALGDLGVQLRRADFAVGDFPAHCAYWLVNRVQAASRGPWEPWPAPRWVLEPDAAAIQAAELALYESIASYWADASAELGLDLGGAINVLLGLLAETFLELGEEAEVVIEAVPEIIEDYMKTHG